MAFHPSSRGTVNTQLYRNRAVIRQADWRFGVGVYFFSSPKGRLSQRGTCKTVDSTNTLANQPHVQNRLVSATPQPLFMI